MMPQADLLIEGASELATPISNPDFSPAEFSTTRNGSVAAHGGKIVAVGDGATVRSQVQLVPDATVINAAGQTLTPGLVDCHTHPVFSRTREDEFEMRIKGQSYEEIAKAGGGILSSVRHLRQTTKADLVESALPRMDTFLSLGTTTIEAKSGYGLTLADEVKMLEVIAELNRVHPIDLVPTFLGAHEIPDEFRSNRKGYIDLVTHEMLPAVKQRELAVFCDVFCESHVFSVAEAKQILLAARELGFGLKTHAEQLSRIGGTMMAAELGAISADHLDYTTPEDWNAMLQAKVVPVLLPAAVFFLGKSKYADAKAMLRSGLPLALATDLNPGSAMTESLPMVMTLACLQMGLTPSEAITAATYHAALALGSGNFLGSIEVGKKADLVLWGAENHRHIPYHFGVSLVKTVIKSGKVVRAATQD